jgi:pimeloyl-ACP methyl ester carboxylesterase
VAEVTLDACVERLCEVLRAGEEPAVVVPNSMGGVITTMAAARCPERVAVEPAAAVSPPRPTDCGPRGYSHQ